MPENRLGVQYADGRLTLSVRGDIDHHTARPLREQMDRQLYLYHPSEAVLALDNVNFMDSSGLGLILGRLALCRRLCCALRVTGADARMLRIFRLAGVERIGDLTVEGLYQKEEVLR